MAKYVQPNFIVDSSAAFLRNVSFDSSVYLKGIAHISSPATAGVATPYALTVDTVGANVQIKSKQLGTMAFEASTNYYVKTEVDSLIADVSGVLDTRLDNVDLSLNLLFAENDAQDVSINFLNVYRVVQDTSLAAALQQWKDSNRSGFVDRTQTTYSFNDGTGEFTLTDAGSGWQYYRDGVKWSITGNKTVALPSGGAAPTGIYYVTIQDTIGTLSVGTSVWDLSDPNVLPVAYILWNAAETPKYWVADERHTMLIDRRMHYYLHTTQGTKLVSGGVLDGPTVGAGASGIGVTDASNAFGVGTTVIADEDIFLTLAAKTRPVAPSNDYAVFFRTNVSTWTWDYENSPLPSAGSYILYDNAGTMTAGQSGKFYTTYLAYTDLNDLARYMILPGRGEFNTLDEAKDEDVAAFDFTGLPAKEFFIGWKFVWEASVGYTSEGKVSLATAPIRVSVNVTTASGATTEAHNDLIGLQGGNATERYHLSAAQYTDYAGKAYVDGSLNTFKTGYVDPSLNALKTRIDNHDTSIATLNNWDISQDASIVALRLKDTQIDASIVRIDGSINNIYTYQAIQDASIVAVGGAWKPYVDGSLATRDSSIIALFAKNAAQDASIVRIDSSLNDTIDLFAALNASLGDYVRKAGDTMSGALTFAGAGFTLDAVSITSIDTSADGLVSTNNGLPTSGAVKKYVDQQIGAGAAYGWNGLTKTDNSIGLGGTLIQPTTIVTSASNTLHITGLQTSVLDTPYALVFEQTDGSLRIRALGSMAWATTTDYTLKSLFDSSITAIWTKFGNVDTSLNNIWTKFGYVDSSMATMNTWNINQDLSIAAISVAQGNYVKKSGDTMSGPLTISAGGLSVANDVSISGTLLAQQGLIVNNNAYIAGSLTIDGSLIVRDVETIDVSAGFIRLNTGTVGVPPPTMQSGIIIERGSANPYVFMYDETNQTFRIGIANELAGPSFNDASTQAVATREDAPIGFGVPFWNSTTFRFETSAGFIFTPGVGLGLPIATNMGAEATALVWDGTTVGSRELGSMAFNSSTYVLQTQFDSSITAIWTKFGNVDTSLNNLGIKNAAQDTSIANLDLLTQVHTAAINDLSTGKLDAVASTTGGAFTLYAGEANNIAYIKQLVAGSGATISQDGSTVTIGVTGVAGYVSKYRGTFDGTAASPFVIAAGTHSLGVGPLNVAVYENDEQVYTGVTCADNGDVTLTWGPGSLVDASCKFIITG